MLKEKREKSQTSPCHQKGNEQTKIKSLINTRLIDDFNPWIHSTGNKRDNDNSNSNDSEASMSTANFLHDYDGNFAWLCRTFRKKLED